jgi:hypothetical protein
VSDLPSERSDLPTAPRQLNVRVLTLALVGINAAVLAPLAWLAARGTLPLIPWVPLVMVLLIVVNIWVAYRIVHAVCGRTLRLGGSPGPTWIPAVAFTLGSIIALADWIVNPDLSHLMALVSGILIASFCWYLWLKLKRIR